VRTFGRQPDWATGGRTLGDTKTTRFNLITRKLIIGKMMHCFKEFTTYFHYLKIRTFYID